jgi:hypothetical protein
MRRSALMGLAAVAFVASNAFAQATSFAGTWNMVQDPAQQQAAGGGAAGRGGRGGGMGGFGATFTVAQDASTLTITQTRGQQEIKSVYKLDGTESKNTVSMGRGDQAQQMEQISIAKWEGANLVITTKQQMGEQTFETKRTLSLGTDGTLTIETASTQPGRDGQPRPAQKVQYKKG